MDQVISSQSSGFHTPDKDPQRLETPYVGMLFETMKEAGEYYEDYGRQEGFWIRIRS